MVAKRGKHGRLQLADAKLENVSLTDLRCNQARMLKQELKPVAQLSDRRNAVLAQGLAFERASRQSPDRCGPAAGCPRPSCRCVRPSRARSEPPTAAGTSFSWFDRNIAQWYWSLMSADE